MYLYICIIYDFSIIMNAIYLCNIYIYLFNYVIIGVFLLNLNKCIIIKIKLL